MTTTLTGRALSAPLQEAVDAGDAALRRRQSQLETIAAHNQVKVLQAFQTVGLSEGHFAGTSGYGFHDDGREALDRALAAIFGAEAGLVRWQFVSGTHAIASVLLGNLRPGDRLLCATGAPYDTLKPVLYKGPGSLEDRGIHTGQVDLDEAGRVREQAVLGALTPDVKAVFIQRSCGYDWRPSMSCEDIGRLVHRIKFAAPHVWVLVDNCYGEMVEGTEPTQHGADVVAGSLIKNLGGGVCPTGGYVAGRKDLVAGAARALTAPGIEGEVGATLGITRTLCQGLFYSPLIVGEALAGAVWASAVFRHLGYTVSPGPEDPRTDIIQAVKLGTPEKLLAFCKGVQSAGPVDHRAVPHPVMNPGYRDPIVMAGGTFIQGSSIELSADGPLREPYAVYLQGGVSRHHVKFGVLAALDALEAL